MNLIKRARQNKAGFTLIEAVLCTALISLITAAFLSMTLAGVSVNKHSNDYARQTSALVSAYEAGSLESSLVTDTIQNNNLGTQQVDMGTTPSGTFALKRAELVIDGENSGITYYYFSEPVK